MKCKWLGLALALALLMSVTGPVLAVTPGDYFTDAGEWSDEFFAEAAHYLGHAGIFIGDGEGNLRPDEPFTRAQMAVVLARLACQSRLADAMQFMNTNWEDDDAIPTWARGAFVLAEARGWFLGDSKGYVHPNDNVTFAEIAMLLARVTENEPLAVGPWPTNALIAGNELGLFDDLPLDPVADVPVFRGDMVSMTFKAALAGRWDADDEEYDADAKSLLERCHEATFTAWQDEKDRDVVTGEWTRYSSFSERMTVADARYDIDMDEVEVVINTSTREWRDNDEVDPVAPFDCAHADQFDADSGTFALVFKILEGETVTVTLEDDTVVKIEVMLDTFEDVFLADIEVADDEADFGWIALREFGEPVIDDLEVDEDTNIWLNGDPVTLEDLEAAFDAFQDEWGSVLFDDAKPVITARTVASDHTSGSELLDVWVWTENLLVGTVTAWGSDFIRVDGDPYDLECQVVRDAIDLGDEYTFLLNSKDAIVDVLDTVAVEEGKYFAVLLEYGNVDIDLPDDESSFDALDRNESYSPASYASADIRVKLADGSEVLLEDTKIDFLWHAYPGGGRIKVKGITPEDAILYMLNDLLGKPVVITENWKATWESGNPTPQSFELPGTWLHELHMALDNHRYFDADDVTATMSAVFGGYNESTETWIRIDQPSPELRLMDEGPTPSSVFPLADEVFYYDAAENEFIERDEIETAIKAAREDNEVNLQISTEPMPMEDIILVKIDGVVGLVVVNHPNHYHFDDPPA